MSMGRRDTKRKFIGLIFVLLGIPASLTSEQSAMQDSYIPPWHKKVDQLSSKARLGSMADVNAYVDALFQHYGVNEKAVAGIDAAKARLVRAEYLALGSGPRIPELAVVDVFNALMNEWGAPPWARTTVDLLHALRVALSRSFYPHLISRGPEGEVLPVCRPVEAVYMLKMLEENRGLRLTELAHPPGQQVGDQRPEVETSQARLMPMPFDSNSLQREAEYLHARREFFTNRRDFDWSAKAHEILSNLKID